MIDTKLNDNIQSSRLQSFIKLAAIIITIPIIFLVIHGLKLGISQDKMVLVNYIKKFGILAPICFIIFQIIQVIIPIIPGAVCCLAGVLAFGPIPGFIYNYIGVLIGSTTTYYISHKYGLKLINKLFKKETIDKYLNYIKENTFLKIFCIGILLPGFPDDLLCYIAGISNVKLKKFLTILLIGKTFSLLTYSLFMELL